MYQHFDSNLQCYIGGPLRIKAHAHDKNASVNKFIREERTDAVIQTWPKNEEKKNKWKKWQELVHVMYMNYATFQNGA